MAEIAKSAKTTEMETRTLDYALRNVTPPAVAKPWVGLLKSDPGESGVGNEVSGGGYGRVEGKFGAPVAQSPSGSRSATITDTVFAVATADWGIVTHFGVWDAQTGGKMLYKKALPSQRDVKSGDVLKFPSGALAVTED